MGMIVLVVVKNCCKGMKKVGKVFNQSVKKTQFSIYK